MSQLERFKEFCEKWMAQLGMTGWVVYYSEDVSDKYAECTYWIDSRVAVINLSPTHEHPPEELERIAFHEVMHLFLADLVSMVRDRTFQEELLKRTE